MKEKLKFVLVGKTDGWKKDKSKGEWNNQNTLSYVKDLVKWHFGNKDAHVINERIVNDNSVVYPKYFSAGWFMDKETSRELVVISHGDSMEDANKSMIESSKILNWKSISKEINFE